MRLQVAELLVLDPDPDTAGGFDVGADVEAEEMVDVGVDTSPVVVVCWPDSPGAGKLRVRGIVVSWPGRPGTGGGAFPEGSATKDTHVAVTTSRVVEAPATGTAVEYLYTAVYVTVVNGSAAVIEEVIVVVISAIVKDEEHNARRTPGSNCFFFPQLKRIGRRIPFIMIKSETIRKRSMPRALLRGHSIHCVMDIALCIAAGPPLN